MGMKKNYDEIRSLAAVEIQQGILVLGSELQIPIDQISTSQIAEALVEAPSSVLGDLAYGCFSLAKQFKKSPAEIAKRLADILATQEKTDNVSSASQVSCLRSAQAVGPYFNLFFTAATYERLLLNPIVTPSNQPEVDPKTSLGAYFSSPHTSETPRTMVEFSQPNTHKEMHVGHMRNLCLGDALIRLHRFAGYEIISSTYPGDVGTHVAKCLWYMKTHNKEDIPFENRGEWLGRMYSLAHLRLEEEVGTPKRP